MGGPGAWKGLQKNKNGWNDGDGDDGDDDERKDRYREYDVAPDRLKDTDEEASDEDVSTTISRSAHTLMVF
jgi:hypothetical protein